MIALALAGALAAEPTPPPAAPAAGPAPLTLPAATPGHDDHSIGMRTTRAGLWMGGAGITAAAIGFPVTVVGALMSFDTPQPGAGAVTGVGITLLLGGSLTALAGPYVCAAGEFRARKGLAAPPSDALPWIVAGGGAATVVVAASAVITGSDGQAALPFLAVGGATLVGSYVVAAVDLHLLGTAHRAQMALLPTGTGFALVGTF